MKSPFLFCLGGVAAVGAGLLIAGTSTVHGSAAHLEVDGGVLQVTSFNAPEFQHAPDECSGMNFSRVVHLGNGKDVWNASEHGNGPFLVFAGNGKDVVTGSDGADCLVGGAGKDTLDGGSGDDVVIGGPGVDTCVGAPDEDTFDPSCESGAPMPGSSVQGAPEQQPDEPQRRSVERTESARPPMSDSAEPSEQPGASDGPTPQTRSGSSSTPDVTTSPTGSETTRVLAPAEQTAASEPTP